MMLGVLDIDVDLFVDPWPNSQPLQGTINRLDDHNAWTPERVCAYLQVMIPEMNSSYCGSFHESHDEVLWRLANLGQPVHLYHLDSHADLGLCQYIYDFESRFLDIERRQRLQRLGDFTPNEGDWCLYAIACGLIERFDYITHPEVMAGAWDIPYGMDCWKSRPDDGELTLMKYKGDESGYGLGEGSRTPDVSIPFAMHDRDCNTVRIDHIDYVFVTKSPRFTPRASDRVFDRLVSELLAR